MDVPQEPPETNGSIKDNMVTTLRGQSELLINKGNKSGKNKTGRNRMRKQNKRLHEPGHETDTPKI